MMIMRFIVLVLLVTLGRFTQLPANAELGSLGEDKTFFVKTKRPTYWKRGNCLKRRLCVRAYFSQQLMHKVISFSPSLFISLGLNSMLHCWSYSYKNQKVILSLFI